MATIWCRASKGGAPAISAYRGSREGACKRPRVTAVFSARRPAGRGVGESGREGGQLMRQVGGRIGRLRHTVIVSRAVRRVALCGRW